VPIALPRRSSSKEAPMIAREFGTRRAAPTPWSALEKISCSGLGARPHQAEGAANSAMPTENIRRRPR
jgi:hypothetical protein